MPSAPVTVQGRPWRLALAWLLFLGPFFFASYGFSNWLASQRGSVTAIVFDWEHAIPFLAWTIVPYWLIDLLYALSLFLCRTRQALLIHVRRLLAVQLIAVACFIIVPLRFSFERPEAEGVHAWMFAALQSFDLPYNQAPSLHIALLVVLWGVYLRAVPKRVRACVHGAGALIAVSVLTTWQHHFIDLPTGAWLGAFCVWLFPCSGRTPFATAKLTRDPARLRLARNYLLGAIALGAVAAVLGGAMLWLMWAAASLVIVAAIYACIGEQGFQKGSDGSMSWAARCLLWPYLLGASLNVRWWTHGRAPANEIVPGVWLGRLPHSRDETLRHLDAVVDVCAELPRRVDCPSYTAVPMLDLVVPSCDRLARSAESVECHRAQGRRVLVCCALGYSRSAMTVVAWLRQTGRAASLDAAIDLVRTARPQIVLDAPQINALRDWERTHTSRPLEADGSRAGSARPMAVQTYS